MENLTKMSGRDFLRWLAQRLKVDESLEPDDPRYEAIYEHDRNNPLDIIARDIDFSIVESLNFLSGFRGAGKTTELFRLRKMLRADGYFVVYANALDFLLPAEPVDISHFLMVLAGSFSEAIADDKTLQFDPMQEGWWTRLLNYLKKTNIELTGIDVKANVPGTEIGLNFKAALRENSTFRQSLRQKMAVRLGELKAEVHKFFADTTKRLKQPGGVKGVVFIFDQLEQLRDTYATKGTVAESFVTLFANHRQDLQMPFTHMVITMPPWLKFVLPAAQKVSLLYNVKLWENDPTRSQNAAGWSTMRSVVRKRFTTEGLKRYFGKTKNSFPELADRLIQASGGFFYDLMQLLRETLLRADAEKLPIGTHVVDSAISNFRNSFLPIPLSDASWLHQIATMRDTLLKDRSPESVQRMTFFLDTHCALILRNGDDWYDVHPIIRDEIAEIVKRESRANPKP